MSVFLSHVLAALLDFLVKGTFLLLAVALVCRLLRRSSAATRHLVWSVALGGILLLPLLSLSLPRWQVVLRSVTVKQATVPAVGSPVSSPLSPPTQVTIDPTPVKQLPPPNEGASPVFAPVIPVQSAPKPKQTHPLFTAIHFAEIGVAAWIIGSLLVFGQFAVGLRRINRIRKDAMPLDAATLAIAEAARQQLSVDRSVEFIKAPEGSGVAIPVTWGVFRPVVLLPPQSSQWSEDCLWAALLHELAHVSRRDWPTQIMIRTACALCWWHPLIWWAARQAREESERACDDLVLGTGMKAADYAQRLVEVVRSLPAGTRTRTVAIAMAQPLEVEGRIAAVLAVGRDRRPLTRRLVSMALITAFLLAAPLAALRMNAEALQADDETIVTGDPVPPGAQVSRNTRWVMALIYMGDVACPRFPDRPITVTSTTDAAGVMHYTFHDRRTGRDYRDSGQISADFTRLLAQGVQRRPGAMASSFPPTLAAMTSTYNEHLYFTPAQRSKANLLEIEARGWADRNFDLILTDGDMEPSATATAGAHGPVLSIPLFPEGQNKLADFQRAHRGEYMGIAVGDSIVPRAVALVGPTQSSGLTLDGLTETMAQAQDLVQSLNAPAGTEVIGGGIQRAVEADGTIYEADEDMGQQASVAEGYSATLPNGCTVRIIRVVRAAKKGSKWVSGGSNWRADGSLFPAAQLGPDNGWSWPVGADGLAPHFVVLHITRPQGKAATEPLSTYLQLGGTANVNWSHTFKRWGTSVGPFYPKDGQPGTLRVGVAAGPWRTVATLPVHLSSRDLRTPPGVTWPLEIKLDDRPALMYQDRQGHEHTDNFLPMGQRLGNVARRIIAVDTSGQIASGSDWNAVPTAVPNATPVQNFPVATGLFGINFYGPLVLDVSKVKEYRLQTRPYQIVEFRNIQLQPRAGSVITASASTESWQQKEEADLFNIRRIGLLILEYTQDYDGKLPSLKSEALLEKDLDPYLKQEEKYPDPATHQPYLVRGHALFISPLTGKPYQLAAPLSNTLISKIGSPVSTVLVMDGPIEKPDETHWLAEMFADGHVKSWNVP